MKKLEFKTDISAEPRKVWNTMLEPASYRKWVEASWPGSYYQGAWKQGENIKFLSPEGGGTMATLVICKPYELIQAEHIAVISKDGSLDKDSEAAKGWVGSTESYVFSGDKNSTRLRIEVVTTPEWEEMFTSGWPDALQRLKEICEASRELAY